jgi:hypothetical protein
MESSNTIVRVFFRIFTFNLMLVFLIGALVWGITWGKGANDPDIWWHLRNAEHLWQTHHLPSHDSYSFTLEGHEWINHSWLPEFPYYLAWRAKGLVGVDMLRMALAGGGGCVDLPRRGAGQAMVADDRRGFVQPPSGRRQLRPALSASSRDEPILRRGHTGFEASV